MIPEATKEGLEIGRLLVAAGRALDDPTKEHAARRILFRYSRPREIELYKITKREEK